MEEENSNPMCIVYPKKFIAGKDVNPYIYHHYVYEGRAKTEAYFTFEDNCK